MVKACIVQEYVSITEVGEHFILTIILLLNVESLIINQYLVVKDTSRQVACG
jgi:hypothetical protein